MERERRIKAKSKKNKESPIQKEAREYYYALGDRRSQLLVAQHLKKSIQSIALWSRKHKWVEYARTQDAKLLKKDTKLLVRELKRNKDDLKHTVSVAIAKFKRDAENLKTDSIQDLERLTKIFLLLEGEATDIEERKVIFEDVSSKAELEASKARAVEDFTLIDFQQKADGAS